MLDTHCHLTDSRYEADLRPVLARARAAGVDGIVCVASDLDDARAADRLATSLRAESAPELWCTAGVHPHAAARAPSDLKERLEGVLDEVGGAVAIGECGLDYHYDFAPPAEQRRVLDVQTRVAAERGLPLVVHCREAETEMAERVREAGASGVRGVLHCFTGHEALLEAALVAGWLVSFGGLVTFPSFAGANAVRSVPAGRYMLETDGPYLAPVPHRGKRNEPAFVAVVRDRVAELRGSAPDAVERETTAAARAFFRLPTSASG